MMTQIFVIQFLKTNKSQMIFNRHSRSLLKLRSPINFDEKTSEKTTLETEYLM